MLDVRQIVKIEKELNEKKCVAKTVAQIEKIVSENATTGFQDRISEVKEAYELMTSFMLKGYQDPARASLYDSMAKKLAVILADLKITALAQQITTLQQATFNGKRVSHNVEDLQTILENYVVDMAMQSLPGSDLTTASQQQLMATHLQHLQTWFDAILTDLSWDDNKRAAYTRLLCSPSVDVTDQQTLLAAIGLSLNHVFDLHKLLTLFDIYLSSKDTAVKQRALVWGVLGLPKDKTVFETELKSYFQNITSKEDVRKDLMEVQTQLLLCADTEKEVENIRQTIMPNIVNSRHLQIDFSEQGSSIEDIINPGALDNEMEKLEDTMHKMMDLQKSGVDIYFGGFSQMKRFAFFYKLINWFYPYTAEHPDIEAALEKIDKDSFAKNLQSAAPFCDSDKYSLTLAISTVIGQLPAQMREMLGSQMAFTMPDDTTNIHTPAFMRRMYLQDLYRFFKLYTNASDFENPFTKSKSLFLDNVVFQTADLDKEKIKVEYFLLQHKQFELLKQLLATNVDATDKDRIKLNAMLCFHLQDYHKAKVYYEQLIADAPQDEKLLKALGQSCFHCEDFVVAGEYYHRLCVLNPENTHYALNKAIIDIKLGKTDGSLQELYRLDYLSPNNLSVMRALAWALMCEKKYETALGYYQKILLCKNVTDTDHLHHGYCQWFVNKVEGAYHSFCKFVALQRNTNVKNQISLAENIYNDKEWLLENGLLETDLQIMLDMIDAQQS